MSDDVLASLVASLADGQLRSGRKQVQHAKQASAQAEAEAKQAQGARSLAGITPVSEDLLDVEHALPEEKAGALASCSHIAAGSQRRCVPCHLCGGMLSSAALRALLQALPSDQSNGPQN